MLHRPSEAGPWTLAAGTLILHSRRVSDPSEHSDTFDDGVADFSEQPGRLGGHPIASVLGDEVVFVEPHVSIRSAARTLERAGVGLAVVGSRDAVVGVVSERDIVRAVAAGLDLDEKLIDAIETEVLTWATVESTIDQVAEEMLMHYLRHVLVADLDGHLAGVVSMRDVLASYAV